MDGNSNGHNPNGRQPGGSRPPWDDWPHESADDAAPEGGGARLREQGDRAVPDDDSEEMPESGWVSAGGVLEWAEPDSAGDLAAEADSPLAADDLSMPEGAPSGPRLRAVHAWLTRRRLLEHDVLGNLLLAQREQRDAAEREQPPSRRRRRGEPEPSPLDLTLAEHQASADEYDTLLTALDEMVDHTGPDRALVEFYLWLGEHLAALAADPNADDSGGPTTTAGTADWFGRAQAALATRTRVEQITAPAQDD